MPSVSVLTWGSGCTAGVRGKGMVSSGKVSVIICYRVNVGVCNVCVGACTCECTCTRKCDNVHSCMDTCIYMYL